MAKLKMKPMDLTVYILASVGALNWGLAEVLDFNVVNFALELVNLASYSMFIYGAIGLAGACSLAQLFGFKLN